jgi:hypothetical protein
MKPKLRPPLPPPASHKDAEFISVQPPAAAALSDEVVAAIATTVSMLLPAGDLARAPTGHLRCTMQAESAWTLAARLEGVARGSL